jgi:FLVCR family feline leukemia virus subgroup C receptor-related protein
LIYILFGTIGGTLASILIDRQIYRGEIPKYDFYIKLFITIGLAALVIQAITISYNNIYIIGLTSAFIGVGLNSYFPLALQSYVECLYPSFELVLITALMVAANLFGFIANYVLVIPMFERIGLWIVVIMLTPCYIYLMLGYETVLLRSNVEK